MSAKKKGRQMCGHVVHTFHKGRQGKGSYIRSEPHPCYL